MRTVAEEANVAAETERTVRDIAGPDSPAAWRIAIAAFLSGFVTFGVVYSFGVFLQPIANDFGAGRAAVGAYYAIASLVWYMLGPFTGHISDRIGARTLIALGALSLGLGLGATAMVGQLWVGYVSYGVGVGLAAACAYVPSLGSLGSWFVKKRNVAFGIAAAGTGVGMLVVPPLAASLIERFGWRSAMVALGAFGAAILAACALLQKPLPQAAARTMPAPALGPTLGSRPFVLMYGSWVLATSALFVPFMYLPQFASTGGASPVAASALLSILGGISVIGRLGIGSLGQRTGNLRLFKAAVLMMALSYLIWLALPQYWGLVLFAICLGLPYGIRIALVPPVLIDYFGAQSLGAILGVFFTATGLAAFIGPMLAGYVVDVTGSFEWGIGLALLLGALGFAAILPLAPTRQ
jgi:MFS family permease